MALIKICGLKRPEDIEMVNLYKPDFCGFIINFPRSHRSRTPDEVRALVQGLDRDQVKAVGVFVNTPVDEVAALINDGTLDLVQLHGKEDEAYISQLRQLIHGHETPEQAGNRNKPESPWGDGRIIKAFKIDSEAAFEAALESSADYILLDQGQGSGETFDWSLIRPEKLEGRPWFLAGGINASNADAAIRTFHPFALDLSSSVETDNYKDPEKVRNIIETVRRRDND